MPKTDNGVGWKRQATSQNAAEEMSKKAPALRTRVLEAIREWGPMTADDCADNLGESLLAIRPRVSELANDGKLVKRGTGSSAFGKTAIVWGLPDRGDVQ